MTFMTVKIKNKTHTHKQKKPVTNINEDLFFFFKELNLSSKKKSDRILKKNQVEYSVEYQPVEKKKRL